MHVWSALWLVTFSQFKRWTEKMCERSWARGIFRTVGENILKIFQSRWHPKTCLSFLFSLNIISRPVEKVSELRYLSLAATVCHLKTVWVSTSAQWFRCSNLANIFTQLYFQIICSIMAQTNLVTIKTMSLAEIPIFLKFKFYAVSKTNVKFRT